VVRSTGDAVRKPLDATSWVYLLVHALVFSIGISMTQLGHGLFVAIGTSLIATGVAGWVIFFWVRQEKQSLKAIKSLQTLGVTEGFPARSVPIRHEYEQRFNDSRTEISIIGFGLNALRGDFLPSFPGWASRTRVRILLVDPEFPGSGWSFAGQKDAEEGNLVGTIRSEVKTFLDATAGLRAEHPDTFQVRLYTAIPSMNVCVIDDEIFWGPYIVGQQSRNMPTFLCRRGGTLYEVLHTHFDTIWGSTEMSRPAENGLGNE
jgi:hypothetical protein